MELVTQSASLFWAANITLRAQVARLRAAWSRGPVCNWTEYLRETADK